MSGKYLAMMIVVLASGPGRGGFGLRCWVGHYSERVSKMRLMECSTASTFSVEGVDVQFGDYSGSWDSQWACSKVPSMGSITKDCVLVDNLPLWWGRLCNGGVCYCNDGDGCNQSNRMFNILSLLPTIICMVSTYAHDITL